MLTGLSYSSILYVETLYDEHSTVGDRCCSASGSRTSQFHTSRLPHVPAAALRRQLCHQSMDGRQRPRLVATPRCGTVAMSLRSCQQSSQRRIDRPPTRITRYGLYRQCRPRTQRHRRHQQLLPSRAPGRRAAFSSLVPASGLHSRQRSPRHTL